MNFYDLANNEELTICVENGQNKLEIKSKVLRIDGDLYIKSLHYQGKLLNFNSNLLKIDLIYMQDEKQPIMWNNVKLKIVEIADDKHYTVVLPDSKGKGVNRREHYRLGITIGGMVQMEEHHKVKEIIVKDISQSGFSFVSDEELAGGNNVNLTFYDVPLQKRVKLKGRVVRRQKTDRDFFEYGCELFNKESNEIASYINTRQRYILSKTMRGRV